jgi:hypothetical protein
MNHHSSDGWTPGLPKLPYKSPWFENRDETYWCFFLKSDSFRKLPQLQNARAIIFQKRTGSVWYCLCVPSLRSRDPRTSDRSNYKLGHRVWRSIFLMLTYNSALYSFHVSSGDFTTVEMNTIERTLNNSCSQSLARKRDSWILPSMFSKHLNLNGTKPQFAETFRHYITKAEIIRIEGSGQPLRWGWVFLERAWILSRIQFTTHFIDFLLCKRNDSLVVL